MKYVFSKIAISLVSSFAIAGCSTGGSSHGDDAGHDDKHDKYSVGKPADGGIDRRVSVSLEDSMRFKFSPSLDTLKNGESIQFVVRNNGKIPHEFSIGNAVDQKKHAEMMLKMPGMTHKDPNTVSLKSGESATLGWTFQGDDTVVFACNVPGHFEAGMRHDVKIGG